MKKSLNYISLIIIFFLFSCRVQHREIQGKYLLKNSFTYSYSKLIFLSNKLVVDSTFGELGSVSVYKGYYHFGYRDVRINLFNQDSTKKREYKFKLNKKGELILKKGTKYLILKKCNSDC